MTTRKLATQAFLHQNLHPFAQFRGCNLVHDLVAECHLLQDAGFGYRDAACPHVEEFVRIEPSDGRAVAAFHIIGIDLQLRPGIGLGGVADQQVVVGLVGLRLLRVRDDPDQAVEMRQAAVVENPFEYLVAMATRNFVGKPDVIVHPLVSVGQVEAAEIAGSVFSLKPGFDVVADDAAMQRKEHHIERCTGCQRNLVERFVVGLVVFVLHDDEFGVGVFFQRDLRMLHSLERVERESVGAEDDPACASATEMERLGERKILRPFGTADGDKLQHLGQLLAFLQPESQRGAGALHRTVDQEYLPGILERDAAAEFLLERGGEDEVIRFHG